MLGELRSIFGGDGGRDESSDFDWETWYTLSELAMAYARGLGEDAVWVSSPVVDYAFVATNLDDDGLRRVFVLLWQTIHRYRDWLSTEASCPELGDSARWAMHNALTLLIRNVHADLKRKGLEIGALDPKFLPPGDLVS